MNNERYKLIPGIGIEDTQTSEIYVTLLEITHLLNQLNNRSKQSR